MKMLAHISTTLCFLLGCGCIVLAAFTTSNQTNWTSATEEDVISQPSEKETGLSNQFITEIFEKYGHNGVITLEGFEHLLENLGLGGLTFDSDHELSKHREENTSFASLHDPGHSHAIRKDTFDDPTGDDDNRRNSNHDEHGHSHDEDHGNAHGHADGTVHKSEKSASENERESSTQSIPDSNQSLVIIRERCLNTTEILLNINANPAQANISVDNFMRLCPIIVYELDQQHCRFGSLKHEPNYLHERQHSHQQVEEPNDSFNQTNTSEDSSVSYVWFYSSMAVLIISVSGMLCVAIIPVIQRCFYQQLIQYLVALAIGSLTGDALLHLLPHAMVSVMGSSGGHGHDHGGSSEGGDGHTQTVWIGLMALCGICLFFTAEQGLNALNTWKHRRDAKKGAPAGALKGSDVEMSKTVGEKLSKQNYNSYGYQYEEVATEMIKFGDSYEGSPLNCYEKSADKDIDEEKNLLNGGKVPVPVIHVSEGKDDMDKDNSGPLFHSRHSFHDNQDATDVQHDSPHHGHGHSHNHTVPATTLATVWMVIAGDGLHNFTDGMAIGAAFSNGLTGGLSTSIAVFCHELPHELGDFALLLKAGMSIKQGLFYNGLSSILCFMGMTVGLAIGNVESANAWVFAGAAGMFLYIALVDMVPELHSGNSGGSCLARFLIQAFGIATGITIMCLIALYEEDMKKTFETS